MNLLKVACIPLVTALTLCGCATMNEQECKTADWRSIGFKHGASGYSQSRIGEIRKDCADHGVRPDLDAYRVGHEQGARQYCTPINGYQIGRRGGRMSSICPNDLAPAFGAEYQRGAQIYRVEYSLRAAQRHLQEEQHAVEHDKSRIIEIESLLIHESGDVEKRKTLIAEMRALETGLQEHYRQIDHWLYESDRLRAQLAELEP